VNAQKIFKAFNRLNVLIVGDVMLDRYLTGQVDRVSPEAPVPVVLLKDQEDRLGGAANVALNLQSMGARPYLCSVIGDDANADIFEQLLPDAGINAQGIIRSDQRCTTVKTRVIAASQHLLRVDREQVGDLSESEQQGLMDRILDILNTQKIHVILFQDYNKGVLSLHLIRLILLEAVRREIPTVVDPKKQNFFEFRNTTLFKPNLKEIQEAVPFKVESNLKSLSEAAYYLRSEMRNNVIMVTLSEQGIFIDTGVDQRILPTQARKIADVCGAGDTVISIAALGIALGLDMNDIAILANLAGGQVCERVGVVPVHKKQLMEEYLRLITKSET